MSICQGYDFDCSCFSSTRADILQIELKADDLYDKEKVDLETIVIEDVFTLLQCNDQGLTAAEAQRRFEIFGPNKLEQEEQNPFLQVVYHTLHTISI
jgi:H+-transporting ATPase